MAWRPDFGAPYASQWSARHEAEFKAKAPAQCAELAAPIAAAMTNGLNANLATT
jgi:hypothetical protein